MTIVLEVAGRPAPKGSPRIVRNKGSRKIKVLKDSDKTEMWHECVARSAARALKGRPQPAFVHQALAARLIFWFPRPSGHFSKNKSKRGQLVPSAPAHPAVKPDIDKLVRATLDPLEGIVFDNDSRIVELCATKRYLDGHHFEGAYIELRSLEDYR